MLILCGGLGTRLRPMTNDVPKPMIPINGKPFLEHLIKYYKKQGITDFVLAVSYLKEQIIKYFGDGSILGVSIEYSEENEPLGTGGAIKNATQMLQDKFFVINGDTFIEVDTRKMTSSCKGDKHICTMGVKEIKSEKDKGFIKLNEDGFIIEHNTKSQIKKGLINAGIYYLDKKVLGYIPEGKVSLENDIFSKNIFPMQAYIVPTGYFIDIGTFDTYNKLIEEFNKTSLCQQ